MYTSEWWGLARCYTEQTSVCVCVSLSMNVRLISAPFRGVPTQWVATDVDALAPMLCRVCVVHVTQKYVFSPLRYRGTDAVGGAICDAL